MKILNTQSGFGIVVMVLIIAVFTAIGGVGYYVWNQNQDTETNQANSVQQEKSNNQSQKQIESTVKPENWTEFTDEQIGLTLPYPKDWGEMSVTTVEWKHVGGGYKISFSNSDVIGMAINDTYKYTGGPVGGSRWQLSYGDSFTEIVKSTIEADELAKTNNSYSTKLIENKANFIVDASGDCVNYGAASVATYNVKDTKNSKVYLLRLLAPAITQPSNCFDVDRDNVLDYVDIKTQQQFIELGSLI